METLEMVKHDAVQVNLVGTLHTMKLLSFLEGDWKSLERWKLEIAEHNLIWYLTARDILKYKYHVNLKGNAIIIWCGEEIRYVGDMPDFAIDRAELALRLGIKKITLHSMMPLPIKRIHIDPVMIGWLQDPEIRASKEGKFLHYKVYQPTAQGVVLAVWNNEKELEIC